MRMRIEGADNTVQLGSALRLGGTGQIEKEIEPSSVEVGMSITREAV